ncbi:MAG: hypothetical protein JRG91_14785 [Deltaproteobacteria bacterium]|nr:hypothetical protein [Deltaproteobacteria bacterium]
MVPLLKKRIPDELALELKPDELPPVEPELAVEPPRPFVWAARSYSFGRITTEMREMLVGGRAVRAWVTHYASQRDPEGTDHLVQFAFEANAGCLHGSWSRGFDDYHLAVGSSDYSGWLDGALRPGGTFTVLFEDAARPTIYGTMKLYIEENLVGLAAKLRLEPGSERLVEQFLRMAMAPSSLLRDDREEYLSLLEQIGFVPASGRNTWNRNLEHTRSEITAGNYDDAALTKLARLCRKYAPGTWAAT